MSIVTLEIESNLINSIICLDIYAGHHSISSSDSPGLKSRQFRTVGYLKKSWQYKVVVKFSSKIIPSYKENQHLEKANHRMNHFVGIIWGSSDMPYPAGYPRPSGWRVPPGHSPANSARPELTA